MWTTKMAKRLSIEEKIERLTEKETNRWRRKFKDDSLEIHISFKQGWIPEGFIILYRVSEDNGNKRRVKFFSIKHSVDLRDAIGSSNSFFGYTTKKLLKEFETKFLNSDVGIEYKLQLLKL